MQEAPVWPQHAIDAVAALNASIPPEWIVPNVAIARFPIGSDIRPLVEASGILTTEELAITSLDFDATDLIARLQDKTLTAVQCVTAFAKRAAIAHQAVDCLADFFFEDALARA
ncbi:MAG: hypothetical protein CYPHOPRED_003612 [Cyphobasidiales sp. Tagirdzhanova-0007]|nr:MAG: hypothetical protein CYPHOPRED_003612 [Cyphobasidiales sp. Tagirdzhanova-0007]